MALITGLRAAVMLDYVPCTPPMLQQLCELLFHLSQVVTRELLIGFFRDCTVDAVIRVTCLTGVLVGPR